MICHVAPSLGRLPGSGRISTKRKDLPFALRGASVSFVDPGTGLFEAACLVWGYTASPTLLGSRGS